MACKYKYKNNWYSKDEIKEILLKERGINSKGELIKPTITNNLKQAKITRENTTSIESVKNEVIPNDVYGNVSGDITTKIFESVINPEINASVDKSGNIHFFKIKESFDFHSLDEKIEVIPSKEIQEELENKINQLKQKQNQLKKEYTDQALTNLRIAALKEVARKYPRSLITSKVVPINPNLVDNSEIQYSKISSQESKSKIEKLFNNQTNEVSNVKPDVILPIGTSGSGKSTFIKSLPQENLVVIEPDAMRVEFTREEQINQKLQELINNKEIEKDCTGKLKAEKGLATSFAKGGTWKVIKDLKGYPTHKEGGVDLTIGKGGVSIKNGNTQFTAKHGLVIPKAQNGLTIPSWMNPKNWGVTDYSDKYKTQGEAYKNAQDKSEFLYNGVRIKKDIASDNRNSAYLQNKNYWREYKNYLSENFSDDEVEKRYNDALDLHYRYGNPKINLLSDDDAKSGKYQTSYSDNLQGGRSNFSLDNSINIFYNRAGKFDRETMFNNYKQEMLHARQLKDKGFNNFVEHQKEDFKRNNVSVGDKQNYDKKMYSDLKSIEGVHKLETEGINARYDRDYELEENSNYKQERLYILNKYKTDDFHPYQNQGDLRVIQKALSEQGYKLPKSTKQDGSFDGVWGDETKNALLKYRKSQNKTKQ